MDTGASIMSGNLTHDLARDIIGAHVTPELLAALDTLFPERSPGLSDSIDQIRYAAGARHVVRVMHELAKHHRARNIDGVEN